MTVPDKKRIITSYERLSDELLELFEETYPDGYKDLAETFKKPNGDIFHAVRLETADASYLVKVEITVSKIEDDEDEEDDEYDEATEPESGYAGDTPEEEDEDE